MSIENAQALDKLSAEVKQHLPQLCRERLEWADTGILPDGKLSKLAHEFSQNFMPGTAWHVKFDLVQKTIEKEAFSFVVAHTKGDGNTNDIR